MRTVLLCALVLAGLTAATGAPAAARASKPHRLSDAQLVRYAASPFDKRKRMFSREVVGLHRGILVVADYPCGDVCPAYTRRIIRYDVPLADCARRGGVLVSERIVRGIGTANIQICKPPILAKGFPQP
jgi:hypothetical protein